MTPEGVVDRTGNDLRRLAERVWTPFDDDDWPVVVGTGDCPGGFSVVEEYAVVPSLARPKFLVPVAAPRAIWSAFTRYHTTSSTRARALGAALGAGFGAHLGPAVFRDRLRVAIDQRIPAAERAGWLLISHLGVELEAADLVAVLPVRRVTPNAKPTMRLFDRAGTPRGYVKVGWSEATREVVRTEAQALSAVAGRLAPLRTPALLASGRWHTHEYAVAEPLPAWVRAWPKAPALVPQVMRAVIGSGTPSRGRLAQSSYVQRVRRDLDRAGSDQPEATGVLGQWLDRLAGDAAEVEFGRWHGDWVPWNLGATPDGPVAWDWEYSDPDVPVGFDLLHWSFQQELASSGRLGAAIRAAEQAAPQLVTQGVAAEAAQRRVSLYLLEMFTRSARLAAAGAGWNPRLHPELLDVAARRDR